MSNIKKTLKCTVCQCNLYKPLDYTSYNVEHLCYTICNNCTNNVSNEYIDGFIMGLVESEKITCNRCDEWQIASSFCKTRCSDCFCKFGKDD